MDDAQAIETLREALEGIAYRSPANNAQGNLNFAREAAALALPALSAVKAQLATHDAAMAAANREVLRCMDERDGWKRAHDLAAADWRAAEAERDELVTLVRIGFLVTVDGERATADVVREPRLRELLLTILQAKDAADARAALARSETPQ